MQCMKISSIDNALRQISYGFSKRVTTYGCYDMNGYRFRSEKYENAKSGLTTVNSGVCVSCVDEDDNMLEYYGVIEDIIKISWEGSMKLEMVLFDCHWFDPTPVGVRRSENLGLVEIKHTSRLSNFEPFVMASQVKQVYYLSYPCKSKQDLLDWWAVYHVSPHGSVLPSGINDDSIPPEGPPQDISFYQEDGLEGHFVIDLGNDLDIVMPCISDEITDPKDLDFLANQNIDGQEDEDSHEDEEVDEDDELQPPHYDPDDF